MKCTVVGDDGVGKTSLLLTYTTQTFPVDYIPAICDNGSVTIMTDDGTAVQMDLWDTIAHHRLRPITYPQTDVFLICFSLDDFDSYENVKQKWYPELHLYWPTGLIILVGTKLDLRDDVETVEQLTEKNRKPVTTTDGVKMQQEIGAVKYVECSSLTQMNVKLIFDEALRTVLLHRINQKRK